MSDDTFCAVCGNWVDLPEEMIGMAIPDKLLTIHYQEKMAVLRAEITMILCQLCSDKNLLEPYIKKAKPKQATKPEEKKPKRTVTKKKVAEEPKPEPKEETTEEESS